MSGDGMASFITSMTTGLSNDALWGAISPASSLIIGLVLFALGFYIVRKLIKGSGKGKVRM